MTLEQRRAVAMAKARLRVQQQSAAPAAPPEPSQPDEADMIAGSPLTRFALGAASPFLGATQLVAEAFGDKTGTETLGRVEEMKRRGMTPAADLMRLQQSRDTLARLPGYEATIARIDEQIAQIKSQGASADPSKAGLDVAGLTGTVMSPAVLAAMKIPAAGSVIGRSAQGAAVGAGLGAASPVTGGGDYWGTKATQTGTGLALGAAIPPAIDAGRKLWQVGRNVLEPLIPRGAKHRAGKVIADILGERRAAVEAELAKNQVLVPGSQPTAAEAAARAGSTELSALQRIAAQHKPSEYYEITKAQEAARLAAVRGVGETPEALAKAVKTRAEDAADAYGAIRHLKIDPRSDAEIMADAIKNKAASKGEALRDWGRFATREAEMNTRGGNFVPVTGMPRVSARASNFPERADEAQQAARDAINIAKQRFGEERFLENTMELLKETVGLGSKNLRMFLTRPSVREAVKDAMKSAQENGNYFPTKAGDKFSIGNLQRIKESMDAGIAAAEKAASAGRRPELSSAELQGTRKAFVEWLSNKSPEWQAARQQYALNSQPINRMRVGQELEGYLTKSVGEGERATVFAGGMRDAPRTIKRATDNSARFDTIEEALTDPNAPGAMKQIQAVLDDLSRKAEFERMMPLGASKASEGASAFGLPATGPLHQQYMIFKTVLGRISKAMNEKALNELSTALKLPSATLKLLQNVPSAQKQAVIDNIITAKFGRGAIAAGAELSGQAADQ